MENLSDTHLLRLSLRFDADDAVAMARFRERMSQPIEWEYYRDRFIHERLEGYFLYNLKRAGLLDSIPESVRVSFSGITAETVTDNLLHVRSLEAIAGYFAQEGIPFVSLKGAHLLQTVYRDYPLRRMSDLDILIRPQSLPDVERMLCREGFAVSAHDNPSIRHYRILAPVLRELMFEREGCKLDVHWGIATADGIAMMQDDRLWARVEQIDRAGRKIAVFSVEDLLLHLCAHLFKNMMRKKMQLVMFCDIIDLVRYYDHRIDWGYGRQSARQEGLEPALYSLLSYVQREGFCQVPALFAEEISRYQSLGVSSNGRLDCALTFSETRYYAGLMRGIPGVRNKVFFAASLVFPRKEWVRIYHPAVAHMSTLQGYLYHWKVCLSKGFRTLKEFFR